MEESHALDMLWHEQSCVEVLGDGTIYLAWMTVHGTISEIFKDADRDEVYQS